MVDLLIQRVSDVPMPCYAHEGDAGIDVHASSACDVASGETKLVKTGLKMAIPKGYVGLVWDRSGLALKHSLHNLAGVIDSGYRGEVGIVVKNLGSEVFHIEKHMRIAQILIQPVTQAEVKEVSDLDETSRAEGGFGSTGV